MFEWTSIRLFLTTFWKPLAIGALVLGSWAGLAYWGHTKYEEGKQVGVKIAAQAKLELAEEKKSHELDKQSWQSANLAIQVSNKKEIARKDAVIQNVTKKYNEAKKELTKKQETRDVQVKAIGPISVPNSFRVLYNAAVADHPGFKGTKSIEAYSTGITSEVATIDPIVAVHNVDQYNALALKCDNLIDLVTENEKSNN